MSTVFAVTSNLPDRPAVIGRPPTLTHRSRMDNRLPSTQVQVDMASEVSVAATSSWTPGPVGFIESIYGARRGVSSIVRAWAIGKIRPPCQRKAGHTAIR